MIKIMRRQKSTKKADIYFLDMLGIFIITGTTDFHVLQQVEILSMHTMNAIANIITPLDQKPAHI